MTADNQERPDSEASEDIQGKAGLRSGIYLQEKKSTIGTGGTAKTAEYRTFWVTLRVEELTVEMLLLNDDFRPTGIRETFAHETLAGPGWHFIAEGEKRYQRLRPYLDRLLAPKPQPAAAKPAASEAGQWWSGGGGGGEVKDPFAREKPKTSSQPAPKKGGWWDK